MQRIDLHGFTVCEAIKAVDQLLSEIVLDNNQEYGIIRVITGNGKIKERLLIELENDWDVSVKEELGNSGVLLVEWDHTYDE